MAGEDFPRKVDGPDTFIKKEVNILSFKKQKTKGKIVKLFSSLNKFYFQYALIESSFNALSTLALISLFLFSFYSNTHTHTHTHTHTDKHREKAIEIETHTFTTLF